MRGRRWVAVAVLMMALVTGVAAGCGAGAPVITALDVSSGPACGHQNVVITGTGFSDVKSVAFGDAAAIGYAVPDDTHIMAITPPGTLGTPVEVHVTTSRGIATLTGGYSYLAYDLALIKGGQIVTYTLADIEKMQPVTGFWGAVNDKPYNTDQYRGVPVLTLLEAVGGVGEGDEIVATSADGFVAVYTPEMLAQMANGTYPMWNVNGTEVITDDRFCRLLLSYDIDTANDGSSWAPLKAGKAPFRIVTATADDGRMTQGPWNPALVVSLEVRAATAAPAAGAPATQGTVTTGPAVSAGGPTAGAEDLSIASLETTSGPRWGYQNVTIRGSGFKGATAVGFGPNPALSFTVADDSRIVAMTPAGRLGQTVGVTVTTPAGTTGLSGAYTYWHYDFKVMKNGKTATYTVEDLKAMPAVTGFWGAHKDPRPYNTDQLRGVLLLDLLKAVGGWSPGESITVTSADGFSTVYTTEIIQQLAGGTYPMWSANGTEIVANDRFAQIIVAYEIDPQDDGSSWRAIEAGVGPLRMALVTKEPDRVNQGKFNPFVAISAEVTAP